MVVVVMMSPLFQKTPLGFVQLQITVQQSVLENQAKRRVLCPLQGSVAVMPPLLQKTPLFDTVAHFIYYPRIRMANAPLASFSLSTRLDELHCELLVTLYSHANKTFRTFLITSPKPCKRN